MGESINSIYYSMFSEADLSEAALDMLPNCIYVVLKFVAFVRK